MEYDVCVFTSAHCANDTRVFQKEVISLLEASYKVLYYTNQCHNTTSKKDSVIPDNLPNLTVRYKENYKLERRLVRTIRSLSMFFWINKNCKVYHFHDPDLIFCGALLKMTGKKVIYDVHENYVDSISEKPYLPGFIRKLSAFLYKKIENILCRRFDGIIAATPSIKASYDARGFKKVKVIYNYPKQKELIDNHKPDTSSQPDTFIYVGGITEIRGISNLVNAIEIVNETKPINLVLAGPIVPDSYKLELEALNGWKNVSYLGPISRTRMATEFNKSTCGICLFKPLKNHIEAMPNKIFEYMSAGLPVLCSNFDLWKNLVVNNNVGYVCNPEDVESIAHSMVDITNMNPDELIAKGRNGIELIHSKYSWESEEKELLDFYQTLLTDR